MVFGWDDAAVGGISAAGGIIGGLMSAQNSRSNADHAFKQQMEARRTAHQDEVADLRAAGLNPVLSAGGSGASTPTATMSEAPDLSGAIGTGINTAMAHKRQKADLEKIQRENWSLEKSAQLDSAKAETEAYNRSLLRTQEESVKSNTDFQRLKNKYMRETLESQIKEAKAKGDWAQVNMLLSAMGQTTSAIGDIVSPVKIKTGK